LSKNVLEPPNWRPPVIRAIRGEEGGWAGEFIKLSLPEKWFLDHSWAEIVRDFSPCW
jgi:hypothetical protein